MRLDVPAETGEVTDAGGDGPLGARGVRYRYPLLRAGAADALDVRRVPAASLAHHAIREPWTAPQPALADARAAGQARMLAPGEVLDSEMTGVLYAGVAHVASLAADGTVTED
jgi:hypothetical protein